MRKGNLQDYFVLLGSIIIPNLEKINPKTLPPVTKNMGFL